MSAHTYAQSPTGAWYLEPKPYVERLLYKAKHRYGRGQFNILLTTVWGVFFFTKVVQ